MKIVALKEHCPQAALKPGTIMTTKSCPSGHKDGTGMFILLHKIGTDKWAYFSIQDNRYYPDGASFEGYVPLEGTITLSN